MKKRLLITAIACVLSMGLVACGGGNEGGGGGNTPDPGPVEPEYEVKISNKEVLQQPWKVGDEARSVGIAPIKGVTIAEAIEQGLIKITSDHTDVVSVEGRLLSPVGVGTATITVSYKEKSDSVDIEVSQASLFKMIAEPQENTDYYVGHKDSDGSGRMVFMKNAISSNYYLGWEKVQENALYAQVKIDTSAADEYKYQISFTTKDEEGVETTKFVGVANTAKGKFAVGIANEEVASVEPHFTPKLANFKLDDEHRLVVKILDEYDNDKAYELVLGASEGYDTFGLGSPEKIIWPARLYVLSDEAIPATSMTVTPEELKLAPGTVGKIHYELEPVETTDSVTFETSDKAVATVDVTGAVTAVSKGTATITVKANANVSKTVAVTVEGTAVNWGSKDSPLTVKEAKEALDALGQGKTSPSPMYIKGEVYSAKWDSGYSNSEIWLKDAEGNKAFELFRAVGDADPTQEGKLMDISGLLPGDKVKAYGFAKIHTDGTYELTTVKDGNPASPTVYSIETIEHTETPEPALVTGKTIAEFLADESGEFKQLYELTGEVIKFKNGTSPDQFGNVYIKDEAGTELYVYGSTATASALAWNKYSAMYEFTNPKDFLANEVTKDVKVGDKLTIKATLTSYQGALQANAIITAVEEGEGGGGETPDPSEANHGTADAPLSAAQAIALLDKYYASGDLTIKEVYIKGKVSSTKFNSQYGNFDEVWLENEDGSVAKFFELYQTKVDEGLSYDDVVVGCTVEAHGFAKIYTDKSGNKTYEITSYKDSENVRHYPLITKIEAGEGGGGGGDPVDPTEINYGTAENPLTAAEAVALLDKNFSDGNLTTEEVYIKGTVSSSKYNTQYSNFDEVWLENEDGSVEKYFELYQVKMDEGLDYNDVQKGAYVEAHGFAKIYTDKSGNKTYEITSYKDSENVRHNPVITKVELERPELTGIKFDKTGPLEVVEGRTTAVKILPKEELALLPEEDPTWKSSDPEVARISEGNNVGALIEAVKEGTAVISAEFSETLKAEITVNVVKGSDTPAELAAVDFTVLDASGSLGDREITDKAALLAAMNTESISEIVSMSKVYAGNKTQGPKVTGLKLGTGSAAGTITLKLAAEVSELHLSVFAWSSSKLAKVTVNGQEFSLVADDASTARVLDVTLTDATDEITISSSMYCVFQSLSF